MAQSANTATPSPGAQVPAPELRRLVVIADDFGMAPQINQAVLTLTGQGLLTGTSAMPLQDAWPSGAHVARAMRASGVPLQMGLHVDLPASAVKLAPAMLKAWLRQDPAPAIRQHLQRQFAAFEAHWLAAPDYVDGHRHIHQWPRWRDLIVSCWIEHWGHPPAWARSTQPSAQVAALKPRVIDALGGAAWRRLLTQHRVAHNPDFVGVYDFAPDADKLAAHTTTWLAAAQDGTLMMCHPAKGLVPGDAIAAARMVEFKWWASPAWARALQSAGVRVARGDELPALWRPAA